MHQHITQSLSQHPLLPNLVKKIQIGEGQENDGKETEYISENLKASDLPALSQQSIPPCMNRIYKHVLKDNHAKHHSRHQFTIFLKTIGLPADEAIEWWRVLFSPKYPGEKFDKAYRYNFRHDYGLEGKRSNYRSPGCSNLINQIVGPNETHGCPFKHLSGRDPVALKSLLVDMLKLTVDGNTTTAQQRDQYVEEVMKLAIDGHHQVACTTLWKFQHQLQTPDENITRPVQYFRQSREFYRQLHENRDKKKSETESEAAVVPSTQKQEII
jgi:DNA primase large subunit